LARKTEKTPWELVEFFCRIADEKKVSDLVVLDVSRLTDSRFLRHRDM